MPETALQPTMSCRSSDAADKITDTLFSRFWCIHAVAYGRGGLQTAVLETCLQSVFSHLKHEDFDFVESLRSETYPNTARKVAKNSKRRNLEIALG